MNVRTYENQVELRDALNKVRKDRRAGIDPAQSAITYGDRWVQFLDIGRNLVTFGRVFTQEEVAQDAGPGYATDVLDDLARTMSEHLLWGHWANRLNVPPVTGYQHLAHVWPIDQDLYEMARRVGWDCRMLPEAGQVLLAEALSGWSGRHKRQAS